jgi:L-fucose isomerase
MNNWGANHCVMSYGHIGADLVSLARILRIPVYMHNLDGAQRFMGFSGRAGRSSRRRGK